MQVVDEAESVPPGQQRGDGVTLALADFEREQAVGLERGSRLGDEATINVEAVAPGEERCGGLEFADLGMKAVAIRGGYIGRIGDDGIEGGGAGGEGGEQIGLDEADAAGAMVAGGVRRGERERGG